jgi:hypothetical protein
MYSVTERVENEGENHSEDLGVDGRIILEWILGDCDGKVWTGSMWLTWRGLSNTVMNLWVQ